MATRNTAINRTVSILLLFIAGILGCWYLLNPIFTHNSPKLANATLINSTQPLKSFSLTTTTGSTFTEKSLLGHWTLMFFGYTNCPTICPTTLNLMRDLWQSYANPPARFIFTSIDQEQDSIPKLKAFLTNFHPEFIGLTGDSSQSENLKQQLGIYVKAETGINDITVLNHTSSLMLINPKGRLHAILSPPFTIEALREDLLQLTKTKG